MKNMMTCLMHSDEEAGQQEQSSTAKVILCSMNTLCSWYQESCDVKSKLNGSNSAKGSWVVVYLSLFMFVVSVCCCFVI